MTGPWFGGQFRPDDPLQNLTAALKGARKEWTRVAEKPLPQIRGKEIDGVLYVRAEDVADALESQKAAPRLVAKLRGKRA